MTNISSIESENKSQDSRRLLRPKFYGWQKPNKADICRRSISQGKKRRIKHDPAPFDESNVINVSIRKSLAPLVAKSK